MSLIGTGSIGRVQCEKTHLMHLFLKEGKTNATLYMGSMFDIDNVVNLANLTEPNEKKICEYLIKTGNFIKLGEAIIVNRTTLSAVIFENYPDNRDETGYHEPGLKRAKLFFTNSIENSFTIDDLDSKSLKTLKKQFLKGKNLVPLGEHGIVNKDHILTVLYNREIEVFFGDRIDNSNKLIFENVNVKDRKKFDNRIRD